MKAEKTKDSFILYCSYAKRLSSLTDAQLGQLFRAIFKFAQTGEVPKLDAVSMMAFGFISEDILINKRKYDRICKRNKLNALKRYGHTPSNNDNDNDNDSDYESDNESGTPKSTKSTTGTFGKQGIPDEEIEKIIKESGIDGK